MFPINLWISLATAVTCILYSCEIFLDLLVLLPSLPGNHYLWFWGVFCHQSSTWNTQGGLLRISAEVILLLWKQHNKKIAGGLCVFPGDGKPILSDLNYEGFVRISWRWQISDLFLHQCRGCRTENTTLRRFF